LIYVSVPVLKAYTCVTTYRLVPMLPNAQPCILIAYVSSKVKYVVKEAVLEILGDNSQECSWCRDKSVTARWM